MYVEANTEILMFYLPEEMFLFDNELVKVSYIGIEERPSINWTDKEECKACKEEK